MAKYFLDLGATVAVAASTFENAQNAVARLSDVTSGEAYPIGMDVSDYNSVEHAREETIAKVGRPVDTLINNAGISPKTKGGPARVWDMDPGQWRQVIDVNLTGAFNCIRCFAPAMKELGQGWIINVTSIAGKIYSPIVSCHYTSSKAGLIGLTRQVAGELGPFGVRVNAIAPGRIETEMTSATSAAAYQEQIAQTPLGRFGQASEVADMAVFLASAKSSFVTGQIIDVSGGFYLT